MEQTVNSSEASDDITQAQLAYLVKKYTEIYADYGKCRQREVIYHLQQIHRMMMPTKTTKMYLWTLQQETLHSETSKGKPSSLFNILSKELEISEEQSKKVQDHRYVIAANYFLIF